MLTVQIVETTTKLSPETGATVEIAMIVIPNKR